MASIPPLPLANILTAVSDMTRWRIFRELLKGVALPPVELARRLGTTPSNMSRHLTFLARLSIVERSYGRVYRIPAHFIATDEPNTLDFGAVRIRLDRLDQVDSPDPA